MGSLTQQEFARNMTYLGMSVFRIRKDTKRPEGGEDWRQLATSDTATAYALFAPDNGPCNLGFVCGSGSIYVIDVDEKNNPGAREYCDLLGIPYSVVTPHGGVHIYVRIEGPPLHTFVIDEWAGFKRVEFRGHGSYVVGPYSSLPDGDYILPHENGFKWIWDPQDLPDDVLHLWTYKELERAKNHNSQPVQEMNWNEKLRLIMAIEGTDPKNFQYKDWIDFWHAVKFALGDEAFPFFLLFEERWQKRNGKSVDLDGMERKWHQLKPDGRIGLATVYGYVYGRGPAHARAGGDWNSAEMGDNERWLKAISDLRKDNKEKIQEELKSNEDFYRVLGEDGDWWLNDPESWHPKTRKMMESIGLPLESFIVNPMGVPEWADSVEGNERMWTLVSSSFYSLIEDGTASRWLPKCILSPEHLLSKPLGINTLLHRVFRGFPRRVDSKGVMKDLSEREIQRQFSVKNRESTGFSPVDKIAFLPGVYDRYNPVTRTLNSWDYRMSSVWHMTEEYRKKNPSQDAYKIFENLAKSAAGDAWKEFLDIFVHTYRNLYNRKKETVPLRPAQYMVALMSSVGGTGKSTIQHIMNVLLCGSVAQAGSHVAVMDRNVFNQFTLSHIEDKVAISISESRHSSIADIAKSIIPDTGGKIRIEAKGKDPRIVDATAVFCILTTNDPNYVAISSSQRRILVCESAAWESTAAQLEHPDVQLARKVFMPEDVNTMENNLAILSAYLLDHYTLSGDFNPLRAPITRAQMDQIDESRHGPANVFLNRLNFPARQGWMEDELIAAASDAYAGLLVTHRYTFLLKEIGIPVVSATVRVTGLPVQRMILTAAFARNHKLEILKTANKNVYWKRTDNRDWSSILMEAGILDYEGKPTFSNNIVTIK